MKPYVFDDYEKAEVAALITVSDERKQEHLSFINENKWWSPAQIADVNAYLNEGWNVSNPKVDHMIRLRHANFVQLNKKLMEIGGYCTCFPDVEEDMEKILSRGQYFPGKSKMMKGRPSRCHSNSANLWEQNRKTHNIRICTGYALSADGIWRQHSWLFHEYDTATQHQQRIIETTEKRIAYFGFIMDEAECEEFAEDNY